MKFDPHVLWLASYFEVCLLKAVFNEALAASHASFHFLLLSFCFLCT